MKTEFRMVSRTSFDHELMENTIIDKKLDNLIGVLKWDLSDADASEQFQSLFDF